MSHDNIGVLVDWLDHYRAGDLAGLLATYETDASLDCRCTEATLRSSAEIGNYWRARMATNGAINLLDLRPAGNAIVLLYDIGGAVIEANFTFGRNGLIAGCRCGSAPGEDRARDAVPESDVRC